MNEANKNEYFVEGFLIKHFNIWPIGFDKNDLFDEQKIFLIYLVGTIPSMDDWNLQISYKKEINEIDNLKKIDIDQADIDVAKLQGRDIKKLKQERLTKEKKRLKNEIDKKYGIKKEPVIPKEFKKKQEDTNERQKLWEILQGKGLIKSGL